ncbi:hypothetical protein DVH05_022184 [Phytophthora capsici]|nr:hypothetical protein DVH05_022184 [Phytophthora capsici]
MVIDQKNLENVIQKIDKGHNSVRFIAKVDSYMKELYIVLNNENKSVKEYHTISLLGSSTAADDKVVGSLPYASYPLSFSMPSKYFKKVVGDISKFSKDFTVERRAWVPLSLAYDSNSKTIDVDHTFTKAQLFKIKTVLPGHEFLSTTVRVEYTQSLATALLSDFVHVFVVL